MDNSDIIQKIIDLRKTEAKDWWEEIPKEAKTSIESGIFEADEGKLNPHSEAKKVYGKWL